MKLKNISINMNTLFKDLQLKQFIDSKNTMCIVTEILLNLTSYISFFLKSLFKMLICNRSIYK